MKSVLIFIIALFASSCCGAKKTLETQPEKTKEIAVVSQTSNADEIPEPKSDDGEILEMVEVVDEEGNTIAEVSSHEEAKTLMSEEPILVEDMALEAFNHYYFFELLQRHVSSNGKVDYDAIRKNPSALTDYISSLGDNLPNDNWSRKDKLAYWINAYNAMTIDLILRHYPISSIKDIENPWKQRYWKLGDKWYNLDEIEHQILRKMNEPRIHFAIVCASESCPKLQNWAFTATNLEEQLTKATKEFLSDTSKNELSKDSIKLSKIFKWFAKDFKQDGSLIDFLNQYAEVEISDKAKKSFKDYSWDLND